ncbi:MAG: helix-turn-helix domain-containing protein [Polyangia bacterium]|jgi:transcriptional regulator with XRE-family HTH domain
MPKNLDGDLIRTVRESCSLSQAELAQQLGVVPGTVSAWETGRAHPRGAVKRKVRNWLGRVEHGDANDRDDDKTAAHVSNSSANEAGFAESIRRGRIKNAWSQKELAEKLGVTQGTISNWENGKGSPDRSQKNRLQEVLGLREADRVTTGAEKVAQERGEEAGPAAFGTWLNRMRLERGLSVAELASKAGISRPAVYNIESGHIENPRPETVRRLEQALGKELPAETKKEIRAEATVEGVGEFVEFDPNDKNDWPDMSGIYVFYDISGRPIYVGQGSNIKRRIQDHEQKFWFKSPIVETAACIEVKDDSLREKIETILIRFLKRNAVINKQNVER